MPTHWSDILTLGTATASAIAATASWVVAVRANRITEEANQAAASANRAAEAVARIERDRWHAELTPQFEVTATRLSRGLERASLRIDLTGPTGLPELSRVVLKIRDDGYRYVPMEGMVPQGMIDATIRGPFRFEPGIDGASEDGRTVTSRPIALGGWDKFSLSPSAVPRWSERAYWTSLYANAPVKLSLECHAAGHQPWYVTHEVNVVEVSDPLA